MSRLVARQLELEWKSEPGTHGSDFHLVHRKAADLRLYTPGTSPTYNRMPMIMQDLRDGAGEAAVVIEGAHLQPGEVPQPEAAVWLIPSREEQRRRLEHRHPDGIDAGMLQGYESIKQSLRGTSVQVWCPDGQTIEETVRSVEELLVDSIADARKE